MEHVDVLIVGAGLSGIGAAAHLHERCPDRSYLIFEGRSALGGTWDLFRYPGIRSDSDMHTLGYRFKPWRDPKAIADGPAILAYIHETAREYGVEAHIRYQHRVRRAEWSTADAAWTVEAVRGDTGETVQVRCGVLYLCAGYYSYRHGYTPDFPGRDRFTGLIVHPQEWPADLDYRGKRVVVIGSGATAITLVPAMAAEAAHVVMLQRSPTYLVSRPDRDALANALRRILPERWAYAIARWKNVALQQFFYGRARSHPDQVKRRLLDMVRQQLPAGYDVATHFTPRYKPWDQRVCLVTNGDLFDAICAGTVSVVTDEIETFTERGLRLRSGREIDADIVVTATGLELVVLGEVQFAVDGTPVDFAQHWTYKGLMYSDVPNMVSAFGYVNASWTLRADLIAEWVCRVLNHLRATGTRQVTPRLRPGDRDMTPHPYLDHFTAGYVQRAMHRFPRQGDRRPWLNPQRYGRDKLMFRSGDLEDGVLVFDNPSQPRDAAA